MPGALREYLGGLAEQRHIFAALNAALMSDGALIHVSGDAGVEQPIEVLHLSVGMDKPLSAYSREEILQATIDFFEAKGKTRIKEDDNQRRWYRDFLEFVKEHLKQGGDYVVKLFQGTDFDSYVREVRALFDKVQVKKPKASRPRSKEVYLLARGRKVQ